MVSDRQVRLYMSEIAKGKTQEVAAAKAGMSSAPHHPHDESEDYRQIGWINGNRPPWYAMLCALNFALLAGHLGAETSLQVESSYYRRLHDKLDPGAIVVFLKNNSTDKSIKIETVKLDGIALPVCNVAGPKRDEATGKEAEASPSKNGAAAEEREVGAPHDEAPAKNVLPPVLDIKLEDYSGRRAIWAYLWPNPVPPNSLAELRIQMAHRQARACKVTFVCEKEGALEAKVGPWGPPVRIASVGFSTLLDVIYLYVENSSGREETIDGFTLNGKPVQPKDSWCPERILAANKTLIAKIDVSGRFAWGDRVCVGVKTSSGVLVMDHVRVMAGAVLGMEHGGPVWDADPSEKRTEASLQRLRGLSDLSGIDDRPIIELFACPMHQFRGHRRKCGQHILNKGHEVLAEAPRALNSVHLCRVRLDEASFLFGQIADVVKINPYFWPDKFHDSPREHSSQRYVRLVGLGASPRPVVTCMMAGSVDGKRPTTPEEVWLMFCYMLSRGAKGFLYRTRPDRIEGEFGEAIRRTCSHINGTVRLLREMIGIYHPWHRGECAEGRVEVNGLLAGDRGMVIVLLNRQLNIPGHQPGPFKRDALKSVTAQARLPTWAHVRSLVAIDRGQRGESIPFSQRRGLISFKVDALETGRILLVEFGQDEE